MTQTVRTILIVAALMTSTFMVRSIRKSRMLISDSLFWFFFSTLLVVLAIRPEIIFAMARSLGILSASNLVYLIIIGLLIIRIFQMDVHMSQLNTKITNLVQDLGIKEHDEKENSK